MGASDSKERSVPAARVTAIDTKTTAEAQAQKENAAQLFDRAVRMWDTRLDVLLQSVRQTGRSFLVALPDDPRQAVVGGVQSVIYRMSWDAVMQVTDIIDAQRGWQYVIWSHPESLANEGMPMLDAHFASFDKHAWIALFISFSSHRNSWPVDKVVGFYDRHAQFVRDTCPDAWTSALAHAPLSVVRRHLADAHKFTGGWTILLKRSHADGTLSFADIAQYQDRLTDDDLVAYLTSATLVEGREVALDCRYYALVVQRALQPHGVVPDLAELVFDYLDLHLSGDADQDDSDAD